MLDVICIMKEGAIMSAYTRYQSKRRNSEGIKITLGKANNLSIVNLWFAYLTQYKVILKPSKKHLNMHLEV